MFPSKATIHQKKKLGDGNCLVYLIDENIGATCQALVRLIGLYHLWSDQGLSNMYASQLINLFQGVDSLPALFHPRIASENRRG
jgi:hypothetical protein